MSVVLDKQEKELTLSFQKATGERFEQKALGLTGIVNNFPVGVYMRAGEGRQEVFLEVVDLKSGASIRRYQVNILDFWSASTKEKAIELQLKMLERFAKWFTPEKIQTTLERRANLPEVKLPVVVEDWKAYAKEKRNAE
jgi:hypothetical protein